MAKAGQRIDDATRAAIVHRFKDGDTSKTIAADYDVSVKTVYNVVHAAGVDLSARPLTVRQPHRIADDVEATIARAVVNGDTFEATAARHGVSTATVHRVMRDARACRPGGVFLDFVDGDDNPPRHGTERGALAHDWLGRARCPACTKAARDASRAVERSRPTARRKGWTARPARTRLTTN